MTFGGYETTLFCIVQIIRKFAHWSRLKIVKWCWVASLFAQPQTLVDFLGLFQAQYNSPYYDSTKKLGLQVFPVSAATILASVVWSTPGDNLGISVDFLNPENGMKALEFQSYIQKKSQENSGRCHWSLRRAICVELKYTSGCHPSDTPRPTSQSLTRQKRSWNKECLSHTCHA